MLGTVRRVVVRYLQVKIVRLETAALAQSANIRHEELAVRHFDQALLSHTLKHAVDVHRGQLARIGEIFLSKRQCQRGRNRYVGIAIRQIYAFDISLHGSIAREMITLWPWRIIVNVLGQCVRLTAFLLCREMDRCANDPVSSVAGDRDRGYFFAASSLKPMRGAGKGQEFRMRDDVEALTLMAEEIALLRDLAGKNMSDPSWVLVRACADQMKDIMDHFTQDEGHMRGEMPWWRQFQERS